MAAERFPSFEELEVQLSTLPYRTEVLVTENPLVKMTAYKGHPAFSSNPNHIYVIPTETLLKVAEDINVAGEEVREQMYDFNEGSYKSAQWFFEEWTKAYLRFTLNA